MPSTLSIADAPELPEMGPCYPDWVFLATRAFVSDRQNSTAAHGSTTGGFPIHVSFVAANPPAVSHLRVHCPDEIVDGHPAVIFSRDNLILFAVSFVSRDCDYFIYEVPQAIPRNPSLHRIPVPAPYGFRLAGIVPYGGDHFAVAALVHEYKCKTRMYKLSVFSSHNGVWTSRLMPLEPSEALPKPEDLRFTPTKVIPLCDSFLGWVDLWRGILLCNVLADNSELRYIPLPEPMPGNEGLSDKGEVAFFRDVCGYGNYIECVEMDYRDIGAAPSIADAFAPDEWTSITSIRRVDGDSWRRINSLDSKDITVAEPSDECFDLLPQLCENGKPSLKKLPIGIPTLSQHNSVLYLMLKLAHGDLKGWVVAIDTESKKLEAIAAFSAADCFGFVTSYYPTTFSVYLEKYFETQDGSSSPVKHHGSLSSYRLCCSFALCISLLLLMSSLLLYVFCCSLPPPL